MPCVCWSTQACALVQRDRCFDSVGRERDGSFIGPRRAVLMRPARAELTANQTRARAGWERGCATTEIEHS
jgi:hypothetical protein